MYFWNVFERFLASRKIVDDTARYFDRLAKQRGYSSIEEAMADEDFRNRYIVINNSMQSIETSLNPINRALN